MWHHKTGMGISHGQNWAHLGGALLPLQLLQHLLEALVRLLPLRLHLRLLLLQLERAGTAGGAGA